MNIETKETIYVIDIGNTSIHSRYINNGDLSGEYKRYKHGEISLLPWEDLKKINCTLVIASQLAHMTDSVLNTAKEHRVTTVEVTTEKQTVIKDTYPTLGIDRICNLTGAIKLLQNNTSPIVVFDFGTATTVSTCNKDGKFLGGIITTGCETELKALSGRTFTLPHVEIAKEQKIEKLSVLTKNTEDAILHGAIAGQVALTEYFLINFEKEIKQKPKIVFTGGNCQIISRFYKEKIDLIDPSLTVKGIYYCYKSIFQSLKT